MWLCRCRDACWCCKCVDNSNLNVPVILALNRPSTTLGTNIETMFMNVSSQHWAWHWDNVYTMLLECCLNVGPQRWEQCCHNIHTMLSEHCLNVIPQRWDQHSHNTHTTLPESCLNIGRCLLTMWQHWDFGWNTILVQCSQNVVWMSTQCCWDI